jgi:hypothetical protein
VSVLALVATVSVELAEVALANVTSEAEQVGGFAPPGPPVIEHVKLTAPENPPLGLIVSPSVALLPGPFTVTLLFTGVMEKAGEAVLAGAITCSPSV